ncbi:MAG: methyltransferase domain-containing protein [Erysipelotrichaceae bacterium]|nr:methyltransferase domain-containing protein [Erysipelotrichaceae bacterium]
MDHFRTQYEKLYDSEEYYWGLEPADFLPLLLEAVGKDPSDVKVLDIGCGEGKDAVYMAKHGCKVTAFDITESGIKKTKLLADKNNVDITAYVDDINTFNTDDKFDIIYSTGTIQYLFPENIESFFEKVKNITNIGGIVYFNVFVDKPYLPLPPDWDKEEKMWKTGDLFVHFADWEICKIDEVTFEDNSGGVKHYHCMDNILARRKI